MTREELWHHSDEQLVDYVRRATEVLEQFTLSDEERAALLPALVNLASAKTIQFTPVATSVVDLGAIDGKLRGR